MNCSQIMAINPLYFLFPFFNLTLFYAQKIEASDISAGVKTFGYSLAGNLDVDGNSYDGTFCRIPSSL